MSAAGNRPGARERAATELAEAERWIGRDPADRRRIVRALAAALLLHATVLVARMPDWGPDPVRVDAPSLQEMKVQFLKPPAPPAVKTPEPTPVAKKIPRPDATPDAPEPEVAPPAPPPADTALQQPTGPIRVAAGQGPGLIKRVEPLYPPIMQSARMEGHVVVDAIIRKDGTVSDVTTLKATNQIFAQAAVDAIKQWRFTPSSYDVILTVTVTFTLKR